MLNKKLLSTLVLSVLVVSIFTPTALALDERFTGSGSVRTTVGATIVLPEEIIIPPINPEHPETEEIPEIPINPELGDGLAILYVSNLDFGEGFYNQKQSQQLIATQDNGLDSAGNNLAFDNMVTITDIRGERDGWELSVRQETELFDGGTVTMNPTEQKNELGVSIINYPLELSVEAQLFASADNAAIGKSGIISIGMGEVTLDIPAGTGIGDYDTIILWNLVSGPVRN